MPMQSIYPLLTMAHPVLEVAGTDAGVAVAAIAMAGVATAGTIAIAKLWSADREREDATRREGLRQWQELNESLQRHGHAIERLTDIVLDRLDRRAG